MNIHEYRLAELLINYSGDDCRLSIALIDFSVIDFSVWIAVNTALESNCSDRIHEISSIL